MAETYREVEVKLSLEDGDEVPSLVGLAAGAGGGTPLSAGEPEPHVLRATYYDTAELDLARHDLTLRRRVGGADSGWHLKVPVGESERTEVRLPPGRAGSTVPAELERLVRARTAGRPLLPVAKLTTRRTVHRLVDASGRPVVELADDRVSARRVLPLGGSGDAAGAEVAWRELEVEAVGGDDAVVAAVVAGLRAHGLADAPHTSKLARVLRLDEVDGPRRPAKRPSPRSPTSSVSLAYVAEQREQVLAQDLPVRIDAPGSVHRMRVATRRLRSALATFRPAFDPDTVTALRRELAWLAGVLGTVRDAEVMHERVVGVLEGRPVQDGPSPDAAEADAQLRSAHAAARDALLRELDGERYHRLLASLDAFVQDPPVTGRGARPARAEIRRGVAREYARVRRLVRRGTATADDEERAELLHDARKAAKRTRYAAELASEVFGKDARRFAAAMESAQELLGRHQDSVVLRARLRELAASTTDPATAFTYGRLHALEEVRARETEEQLPSVWARASRKRLRRWLR